MMKNNVTCGTVCSQWGDYEDCSVEEHDEIVSCELWSSPKYNRLTLSSGY